MIVLVQGNIGDLILLYLLLSEAHIDAIVIETNNSIYETAYKNIAGLLACMGKDIPLYSNIIHDDSLTVGDNIEYLSNYIIGEHEFLVRDYRKIPMYLDTNLKYNIVACHCDHTLNSTVIESITGNVYTLREIETYDASTQFEARSILVVNKFLHYLINSLDELNKLTIYSGLAFYLINKSIKS